MTVTLSEIEQLGLAGEVERMRGHAPDPVMLAEEEKKRKNNERSKAYYWKHREELLARRREKYAAEKQADSKAYRHNLARVRKYCKTHREHRLQVMRDYWKRKQQQNGGMSRPARKGGADDGNSGDVQ